MKNTIWLIVSCLMVLAVLLSSCGPSGEEEEASPPAEEEEDSGPIPIFQVPEQPFAIGDTARSSRTRVTVLDMIIADSYEYDDPVSGGKAIKQAGAGKTFIISTLEIENTGTLRRSEGKWWARVIDAAGVIYQAQAYLGENALRNSVPLDSGGKMTGTVLHEVPKEATGLKLRYAMVKIPEVEVQDEKWAEWEIK